MTDFERIADLVYRNLSDNLSDEERGELDQWLAASPVHQQWYTQIQEEEHLRQLFLTFRGDQAQASKAQVLGRIEADLNGEATGTGKASVHRVHFLKTAWFRSIAAAVLILIIGSVAYLWKTQKPTPSLVQTSPVPMRNDVAAPSRNRATLTLSGGKEIFLDSAGNGTLATEGKVHIQKINDGRIVYDGESEAERMQFNTLTVPRGSQIASIVLSDGSTVFLNAASSLTYPVAFAGNERRVAITGEAYFEVAKDPTRKFIVSGGGMTTEVLGTHFNVNTYSDEGAIKVTLLEGSVKVTGGASNLVIKPGAQAEFASGVLQVNTFVDVDQVMAWKNGLFNFNETDLPAAMRQIARWYDLKVQFEGGVPNKEIRGKMGRDLNLSQVLKILEKLELKFRMEGKTLIVSP